MNWLDWALVLLIGWTSLNGLRRGFIVTLTRLVGLVGAIIAAFVLTKPVSAFLETRYSVASSLANVLARYIRLPTDFGQTLVSDLTSGQLWALLEQSGLPEQYKNAVVTWIAESPGPATVDLARFIHQGLAMLLLNAITFLVLLAAGRWVVALFGRGLSKTARAIGVGGLDHLGGLALGLAQGGLVAALALGLALPLMATGALQPVNDAVNDSLLALPLLAAFYAVTPWLHQIGLGIWERLR